MMIYKDIFLAFIKPAVSTFGGGPSAIPVIQDEVVNNYQWMTESEFIDAIAFGNSLPGPIATKLSAFIGYKVGGWLGSLVAVTAMVVPTALAMILLYNLYARFKNEPWMIGMLKLVKPVIFILILDICVGMRGVFNNWQAFAVALLTAVGLYVLKLPPALLIVCSLVLGGIFVR